MLLLIRLNEASPRRHSMGTTSGDLTSVGRGKYMVQVPQELELGVDADPAGERTHSWLNEHD